MFNINQKYLYKKEFKLDINDSLELINKTILQEYVLEKANLLFNTHGNNKEQLRIKQQIINDFEIIYKYDLKNAIIPEPVGIFKNEKEKRKLVKIKLFNTDFYTIIGNIFAGYIELLIKNNIQPYDIEIPMSVINYKELYDLALYDLLNNIEKEIELEHFKGTRYEGLIFEGKRYANHAYMASYVFPTLVEYFLGLHLRNKLLYSSMEKLNRKINDLNISLLKNEQDLFQTFSKKGNKKLYGNEKETMRDIYKMLVKYNILAEDTDFEMILVGESNVDKKERTIGGILHSNYAQRVIVPEYLTLIKWLFGSNKLNIRNNIMHGNNINFDYFGICFPCIMLQLIWDIGNGDVFVK